jgi:hypothetical protein
MYSGVTSAFTVAAGKTRLVVDDTQEGVSRMTPNTF